MGARDKIKAQSHLEKGWGRLAKITNKHDKRVNAEHGRLWLLWHTLPIPLSIGKIFCGQVFLKITKKPVFLLSYSGEETEQGQEEPGKPHQSRRERRGVSRDQHVLFQSAS